MVSPTERAFSGPFGIISSHILVNLRCPSNLEVESRSLLHPKADIRLSSEHVEGDVPNLDPFEGGTGGGLSVRPGKRTGGRTPPKGRMSKGTDGRMDRQTDKQIYFPNKQPERSAFGKARPP